MPPTLERVPGAYYNLRSFTRSIYPKYFWRLYDFDGNHKIDASELARIVESQWTKYGSKWPAGTHHLLSHLDNEEYLNLCDTDRDGMLE